MIKFKKVNIESGKLLLEGMLYVPDGEVPFPGVVVCHPHPQRGGSMDNNVVNAICDNLVANSIVALKFNYRGVSGSQGTFDNGIGEQDDVRAAVRFISALKEVASGRLGIAGYSVGAAWGLAPVCDNPAVKALAAISPPFYISNFAFLLDCVKPKLLLNSTLDRFSPVHEFQSLCRKLQEPKECYTIEATNHIWTGKEKVMADIVTAFFKKYI